MKKMTFSEELAFLSMVRDAVNQDPTLTQKIVGACMEGTTQRLERINDLRVNAEFALSLAYSMIPDSKLEKNPLHAQKIKRSLVDSGSFHGTPMAEELEAQLQATQTAD
mgnify:CR=1 FL=1